LTAHSAPNVNKSRIRSGFRSNRPLKGFSAGARRLHRTQSVVSELVSNFEAQLGVVPFDRSERYPKLTPAGVLLVADARSVVANVGLLKARAKGIAGGLESELSAVVDVLPTEATL
jgi:DNA-binding transcriptional LysR family regulator